jgi:hypothetical protein
VRRGLELAIQASAWLIVTGSLYLVGAQRGEIGAAPGFDGAPVGGAG